MLILSGASKGFVSGAEPSARLGALVLLGTAVMLADTTRPGGSLLVAGLLLAWLPACAFAPRSLGKLALMGLALFLSVLATLACATWLGAGRVRVALAWGVAFKGFALCCLTGATLHTFRITTLLLTLSRMPGTLTLILEQVVHQMFTMADETRRILQTWLLRSASGSPPMALVRAAPVVWLPRVARRAERVTAAMELRGIPRHGLFREHETMAGREAVLLGFGLAAAAASAWLRWARP